jgi:hypothetical protein
MGGAVKPPARSCSRSHRICQMRPSIKPIAIATEISKTVSSTKLIIGMFPSGQCTRLPDQRLPDRFYTVALVKEQKPGFQVGERPAAPDLPPGVGLISFGCNTGGDIG